MRYTGVWEIIWEIHDNTNVPVWRSWPGGKADGGASAIGQTLVVSRFANFSRNPANNRLVRNLTNRVSMESCGALSDLRKAILGQDFIYIRWESGGSCQRVVGELYELLRWGRYGK